MLEMTKIPAVKVTTITRAHQQRQLQSRQRRAHVDRRRVRDSCLSVGTYSASEWRCFCSATTTEGWQVLSAETEAAICCGSQMARFHRMRGRVSNIGNWRWDMID